MAEPSPPTMDAQYYPMGTNGYGLMNWSNGTELSLNEDGNILFDFDIGVENARKKTRTNRNKSKIPQHEVCYIMCARIIIFSI